MNVNAVHGTIRIRKWGDNMKRRKRLTAIDRVTRSGDVLVTRSHMGTYHITTHRNITPTSYTRLRMAILTRVAHGNGCIVIWPDDTPDMLRGWSYYAI